MKLKELPSAFKGDEEVVMAAIKQNWYAIHYASDDLKNKEEVVMA
eukprot:CAMPEP_0171946684 /NCGR_PEP_ID=MMETSP0993-20121228/55822_1 /TAXON_ID=483369 /ORGANISM="non described non described, Strain CCMP2098" /LENGTH=44 /DNA_ID= /DNA_START= /DNA_END= /DNA_ORIENTATION=